MQPMSSRQVFLYLPWNLEKTHTLFKVSLFQSQAEVPSNLLAILKCHRIIKAGRGVKGDLRRIQEAWSIRESLDNDCTIDLGDFAKLKGVTNDARIGLADLSAVVLRKSLSKDPSLQLSAWSSSELSDSQRKYAALDAYASWSIWKTLSSFSSVGLHIYKNTMQHHQLISLHAGKKVVAHGRIAADQHKTFSLSPDSPTIKITSLRLLIEIEEVMVSGYIVPLHKATLASLFTSQSPCIIAVSLNSVRTRSPEALKPVDSPAATSSSPHLLLPTHGELPARSEDSESDEEEEEEEEEEDEDGDICDPEDGVDPVVNDMVVCDCASSILLIS